MFEQSLPFKVFTNTLRLSFWLGLLLIYNLKDSLSFEERGLSLDVVPSLVKVWILKTVLIMLILS